MTAAINTNIINALNSAHAYGDAIAKLSKALAGQLSTEVRATILPYVAAYYKVTLVAKERGEGVTLDKDAPKYDACVKALQRLTKDIVGGPAPAKTEEVTFTRAQLAAIRACHEAGVTMKMYGKGVAKLVK